MNIVSVVEYCVTFRSEGENDENFFFNGQILVEVIPSFAKS